MEPVGEDKPQLHTGVGPSHELGQNIVLTGFMGTGKSTVGRILATLMKRQFVDTDQIIETQHGPIPEIFAHHGEAAFRSLEQAVALDLAQQSNLVIATGGGFLLDPANVNALREAQVYCLTANVEEILRRTHPSRSTRPLLAVEDPAQRIRELLEDRAERYEAFEQVTTGGRTARQVAEEVQQRFTSA